LWDVGENGLPEPAPVPYVDYLAGAYGAAAVLAALLARDATGWGGQIEVPQRDVACQLLVGGPPRQRGPALHVDPIGLARHPSLAELIDVGGGGRGLSLACWHFTRPPWRMYDVPLPREAPAPELGQDSAAVLRAMGRVDRRAIRRLSYDGVVLDAEQSGRGTG
jgi:crotonobetainyl-CoA:carnitine CoA-transferase CaiB-like acyl-CoA transferase